MKEAVLVVIKPESIQKALIGNIITKLSESNLEIIALRLVKVTKALAEEHYRHLKGQPFYQGVIDHITGKIHRQKYVIALIYRGEKAISKCRKLAGATNPEEAEPTSIRGAYGRVTTKGIFENLLHVSSDKKEAEREIKLWFEPEDITANLFPTKTILNKTQKKRVWA